jgi:hypothetical protein
LVAGPRPRTNRPSSEGHLVDTDQATGLALERDHRCGTAPGSHRTSLGLHHPVLMRQVGGYADDSRPSSLNIRSTVPFVRCWSRASRASGPKQAPHPRTGSSLQGHRQPCRAARTGGVGRRLCPISRPQPAHPPLMHCIRRTDQRHRSRRRCRYARDNRVSSAAAPAGLGRGRCS